MEGRHSSGVPLRACVLSGIAVEEVELAADLELTRHDHRSGQVCFVLEGRYEEHRGTQRLELAPGSVLARPPGSPHSNHFKEPVTVLLVSYEPDRFRMARSRSGGTEGLAPSGLVDDLRLEIHRELALGRSASRIGLESLSVLLLSRISRAQFGLEDTQSWFVEALRIVDTRFRERLTLAGVADAVGVHRVTLSAAFRSHLRLSLGEYVRNKRVSEARRLLISTRTPLAELSLSLGFFDQAHFTNEFRRSTGRTPTQYRRLWSR